MSEDELAEFLTDYDAVTTNVMRSNDTTFQTNLERWFEALANSPFLDRLLRDLEATVDFPEWLKNGEETVGSMSGSGQLRWPKGPQRIAMQVALFRAIAEGSYSYEQFDQTFFGASRLDEMIFNLTSQVFDPMSRDLRKHLTKIIRAPHETSTSTLVPAADRIVRLDHNSQEYRISITELEKLEHAIKGLNDYPDVEDREQRLAELSAARGLLSAVRVRVDALIAVVFRGLNHIAKKFADTAIGIAATTLIALLGRLTGLW